MADKQTYLKQSKPHGENFEIINDYILTQSEMDGLNTLLNWCEGFMAGKGGTVPGFHEVVMFYRQLRSHIFDQRKKEEEDVLRY